MFSAGTSRRSAPKPHGHCRSACSTRGGAEDTTLFRPSRSRAPVRLNKLPTTVPSEGRGQGLAGVMCSTSHVPPRARLLFFLPPQKKRQMREPRLHFSGTARASLATSGSRMSVNDARQDPHNRDRCHTVSSHCAALLGARCCVGIACLQAREFDDAAQPMFLWVGVCVRLTARCSHTAACRIAKRSRRRKKSWIS